MNYQENMKKICSNTVCRLQKECYKIFIDNKICSIRSRGKGLCYIYIDLGAIAVMHNARIEQHC